MAQPIWLSLYFWMALAGSFLLLFIMCFIFIIVLAKKTHAIVEFKAIFSGKPICLFFAENRYLEWKPLRPDAGMIEDKNYGTFIINDRATYVDRKTKAVIIPFDASIGTSVNIHAAKLADDLQYIVKDEEQMKALRKAIAYNLIDDNVEIEGLKTSIHFGALKNMLTAMLPHNITSKIEKTIALRMKGQAKINIPQILLVFAGVFGAIVLGVIVIRLVLGDKAKS